MPSSRKKSKPNAPCSMDQLNIEAENLIVTLGADIKASSIVISDKLDKTKLNCSRVWERIKMFKQWIVELDEDLREKDEVTPITDEEVIDLFNDNGAKNFGNWYKAIRARAALESTDLFDDVNRNQNRDIKRKKSKAKPSTDFFNENNNNGNDNTSDSNQFIINDDEDNDNTDDDDQDEDSTNLDAYSQLQEKQMKKCNKKQFKTFASDLLTFYIVDNYNNCGLQMNLRMCKLKCFYKNNKLSISDINNSNQLDLYNEKLDWFLLASFFDYWGRQMDTQKDKDLLLQVKRNIYFKYLEEYYDCILPIGRNSSLIALFNSNTKPHNVELKFEQYLDAAKKDDNFKIKEPYYNKHNICRNKLYTGVCPDYKTCQFVHNICGHCGATDHFTFQCKHIGLDGRCKKMMNTNHKFNWKTWNSRRYNNNQNRRYNNNQRGGQAPFNPNFNNNRNNNRNQQQQQQNGYYQYVPFNNDRNNNNNNNNNGNNANNNPN